ncbi:MAG: caspase family protein, partial [Methylobacter sp.]|nr:caspase family protein [Methylobacter sp.]
LLSFIFYITDVSAGIDDFISQQVTNQITRTSTSAISKSLNDNLIIPQLRVRNASGHVNDFSLSPDEQLFAVLHQDNTVRVWDSRLGVQRPTIMAHDASKVLPLAKTNSVLIAATTGIVSRYDVLTGKFLNQLTGNNDAIIAMAVSIDESLLLAAHKNGKIVSWNLNTFSKTNEFPSGYEDNLTNLIISPDNRYFVSTSESGKVDLWQLNDGKKIAELTQLSESLMAIAEDTASILTVDSDNQLLQFDARTHAQINSRQLANSDSVIAAAINSKLDNIAVSTDAKAVKLFNSSGEILQEIPVDEDMVQLAFIHDGEQLLGTDQKGIIRLWQSSTGLELLKLIATTTGWTVLDNKGRFDGSEPGLSNVSWDADTKNLPLDSFSEHYYEPGLLAGHLAKKQSFINRQPLQVQAGITLPPEVSINFPDNNRQAGQTFSVTVQLTDSGGGIGGQKLYHNGKVVEEKAISSNTENELNGKLTRTTRYNIMPLAGANKFKAIGENKMGIESSPISQALNFSGNTPETVLHIMTVGINRYKDPSLNLDYSVADAQSIAEMLSQKKLLSFNKVIEHSLFNEKASKTAIIDTLKNTANFGQNDVLALYFAGHGLAINGEWYFMPYETTLQNNANAYTKLGISAQEIQSLLSGISAQKIIVMIDSCYSGASLDTFRQLQNTQRHFGRSVSKSVGVVFLAATRKDQEAAELKDLGHGLFTYVITSGMKGEADNMPIDRNVTAHELVNFSTSRIPTFSRKYLSASQEPTSFTIGDDFGLLRK